MYQKLSEEFIREFQNNIYWPFVICQELSEEFKNEFKDKLPKYFK